MWTHRTMRVFARLRRLRSSFLRSCASVSLQAFFWLFWSSPGGSWIHQTVTFNLVNYHVLGFLPDTHFRILRVFVDSCACLLVSVPSFSTPVIYCVVMNGLFLERSRSALYIAQERGLLLGFGVVDFALAPVLSGNFLYGSE